MHQIFAGDEGLAAESSGKSPEDLELEVEEEGANEAAESDPRARMLRTKTSGSERMTSVCSRCLSLISQRELCQLLLDALDHIGLGIGLGLMSGFL